MFAYVRIFLSAAVVLFLSSAHAEGIDRSIIERANVLDGDAHQSLILVVGQDAEQLSEQVAATGRDVSQACTVVTGEKQCRFIVMADGRVLPLIFVHRPDRGQVRVGGQ